MAPGIMDDPLALAILPDKDETPEQRLRREQEEAKLRKVSLDIDEQLRQDRVAFKKKQRAIKVLILGQSESGKSTTIKNFQLKYAYDAFCEERQSWRAVIHWNLVRSVTIILDIMAKEMGRKSPPKSRPRTTETPCYDRDSDSDSIPPAQFDFIEKHKILQLRLQPLVQIKRDLEQRLGSAAINEQTSETCDFSCHEPAAGTNQRHPTEFFVTSQKGWRGALERVRPSETTTKGTHKAIYDAVEVITRCGSDIKQLWADDVVQKVLTHHKIRLEHSSGFFLNDVDRIAVRDYDPSDDDIVRARLRTMGVQEYYFSFGTNPGITRDWLLYDVGGARSSRAAWPPYFDNINSIIFLAPISCFDQRLAEDRTVNRLEDSMTLWKLVCSSKLLANVQMILFLNKYDILDEKLKSGVRFSKYVINYGDDNPNDASTVSRYLKQQFKSFTKQFSPAPRVYYCFVTSVIDTKAMSTTLGAVYDGIIRNCLKETEFI